ncbi:helix-turn-helix domain-containing protein [Flavobacterium rakeshii]|uniref:Helix-turn-helix domain-containing protein n=1 Tax=Flavobacterium rakeshii TaxID=1038845 RepID=A0A6N8HGA4_9FLAO|nr:helix-turn-helix domain-containing protein [Flavobacterium rakeshii]MUV04762.1 helix-turn-helix domain-containing protein [Flavobacterium rakeshii]
MKAHYLILIFIAQFNCIAQKKFIIPDSLSHKNYNELSDDIDKYEDDSIKLWVYYHTYIEKAKKENNKEELINGYRNILFDLPLTTRLQYTDSILNIATSLKDNKLIGRAYIHKAVAYFRYKNYIKSLDNYLIADKYINYKNDIYTQYKIKYGIANIKFYLGYYQEALDLFTECKDFYKNQEGYNYKQGYLHSLCSTGLCNFRLGNFDKCSQINELGIKESNSSDFSLINSYFFQSEGINQFAIKNYNKSINYLKKPLSNIIDNEDFVNIAVTYMYLGKNYLKLNHDTQGIIYLQKVDSILQKKNYANLDLRETYELLINYYKKKGDLENQLLYTNRLLDADKILEKNYKDLISTIHKEYDTAELVASKNNLEKTLKRNTIVSYIIYSLAGIIILVISYLLIANYKKQKRYKQKYEELIAKAKEREKQSEQAIQATKVNTDELDINKDIVLKILKGLETFEKKEEYLGIGLTQSLLADELDTNTTYLSKVINHYKGKNFNSYLNELRVNHAVSLLKNSSTHRRYTIKALAEELGFSNPRSFSDAFFSQTGIKPSYFIKQIEKEPDLLMSA